MESNNLFAFQMLNSLIGHVQIAADQLDYILLVEELGLGHRKLVQEVIDVDEQILQMDVSRRMYR
jgi:hypothetical protein